jgi:hypothetical protein
MRGDCVRRSWPARADCEHVIGMNIANKNCQDNLSSQTGVQSAEAHRRARDGYRCSLMGRGRNIAET